jgi:hypothetical protein
MTEQKEHIKIERRAHYMIVKCEEGAWYAYWNALTGQQLLEFKKEPIFAAKHDEFWNSRVRLKENRDSDGAPDCDAPFTVKKVARW